MFAVIFEVQPKSDRWDQYLGLAKQLRPELEQIAGFIENERYRSRRTEGRLLSLSIWANEKAVIRWRTHAMHHTVQEQGRFEVFEDYHLRVGEITADTRMPTGQTLEQQRFDTTDVGAAKVVSISEISAAILPDRLQVTGHGGVHGAELFETRPASCCIWSPGAIPRRWMAGSRGRPCRMSDTGACA